MVDLIISPSASAPLSERVALILDGLDVSENTRTQYKREVRPFLEWLGPASITPHTFVAYKKHLRARTDIGAGTTRKSWQTRM